MLGSEPPAARVGGTRPADASRAASRQQRVTEADFISQKWPPPNVKCCVGDVQTGDIHGTVLCMYLCALEVWGRQCRQCTAIATAGEDVTNNPEASLAGISSKPMCVKGTTRSWTNVTNFAKHTVAWSDSTNTIQLRCAQLMTGAAATLDGWSLPQLSK